MNLRAGTSVATVAIALLAVGLAGCVSPEPVRPPSDGQPQTHTVAMKDLKYTPATLTVGVGSTVRWTNQDPFDHTVTPTDAGAWGSEGSGDEPSTWLGQGESWSFVFTKEGTYEYYCIPHASQDADGVWRGMVATVVVTAFAGGPGGDSGDQAAAIAPARPVDVVEIGRSATDMPPPVSRSAPVDLTFEIESREVTATMADGITYTYWTFDGTVPGPMLRARVGDTITIVHRNHESSTMSHNIDFHAATGPGGGAAALTAAPGQSKSLTFKALNAGVYVYHCADASPPLHIAHGMYGLIVIEPEGGLPPVDREFYVVQGDFYSGHRADQQGHHQYSSDAAADERPSFVVFNGRVGSLTGPERQLTAEVGQTVRIFFGVGGPNLVSSFHVIGEIFDSVYNQGSLTSPPIRDLQTTLVPAGGATMVEFQVEVAGDYVLVDHSINRVLKGAAGILHVEGESQPGVFEPGP